MSRPYRSARAAALIGIACACSVGPARAQDTTGNRYTLENLTGVFVRTETGPLCANFGVSSEALGHEATSVLTEAEITLLTENEMLATPGLPDLRITIACADGPGDTVAYSVWLRMQQAVRMVRDPQIQLSEAVTWYASAVGAVDDDDVADAVKKALVDNLDAFAEAFKAANVVNETEPS